MNHYHASHLIAVDESLASVVTRETLEQATENVPDDFLRRTLPKTATTSEIQRRRNAYSAYLWKRLKAPRTFARVGAVHRETHLR